MEENKNDVGFGQVEGTPIEETTEEPTEEVSAEESSTEKEETSEQTEKESKTIPYSRFKEVNDKKKQLESEIQEIRNKAIEEKRPLTETEKKEIDARQYLEKITRESIEKFEKEKQEKELKEQKYFEEEVENILEINPEIKKDDFLKFIEDKADEYDFQSVKGAMRLYKDLNKIKVQTKEATKKEIASRPKFPQNEGISPKETPNIAGKSWSQLENEALNK